MDKPGLLDLLAKARKRAESGDLDIETQHEVVKALERKGLDTARARAVLTKLIAAQELDLVEVERLLDEMDRPQ